MDLTCHICEEEGDLGRSRRLGAFKAVPFSLACLRSPLAPFQDSELDTVMATACNCICPATTAAVEAGSQASASASAALFFLVY